MRNAIARRANPDKFIENGLTPYVEIFRDELVALRHYPALAEDSIAVDGAPNLPVTRPSHRVPLLMVPPLGVHTWVFDLMQERSIVRYFLARGFDVYLIDWGVPTDAHHDLSLDTYINRWLPQMLETARTHSGQRDISMLGYCLGGLFCLMYLGAHRDANVPNLITIASPIDFHAGAAYARLIRTLSKPAMLAHKLARIRLANFDASRFHIPGWMVSLGFRSMNPPGAVRAYLDMVRNLADTDHVTEYMSMGQWFNEMVDYPGGVIQEMAEKLAIANQLATGRLRIGDTKVDLRNVRSALFACAGKDDTIVDPAAAERVMKIVGSSDTTFHTAPGGHAAVFAGGNAPSQVWQPAADWLASRST